MDKQQARVGDIVQHKNGTQGRVTKIDRDGVWGVVKVHVDWGDGCQNWWHDTSKLKLIHSV